MIIGSHRHSPANEADDLALGNERRLFAAAARDHVDEDAEQREEDHEQRPPRLAPSRHVGTAEDVREDHDQQPHPDHPGEEDEHRPHDVEERIRRGERHQGHLALEGCDDYAAGVATPASSNRGGKASRRSTWLGRRNTTSSSCSAVTSEMSLTPRSRNQSQIPMTESSGVEAPDVTPTASHPRNIPSSSARSFSTSQAGTPPARAVSTRRFELELSREPATTTTSTSSRSR